MKQLLLRLSMILAVMVASALPARLLHAQSGDAVGDGAGGATTAGAAAVTATNLTLRPIADTYVDSTDPDTSFASAEVLRLLRINLGATSLRQRTFLRFDLSGVRAGARVQSASLDLFQTGGSANPVLVYRVAGAWDAASTTWNNQPTLAPSPDSWSAPATANQYITYQAAALTGWVQSWVDAPAGNFGLLLDSGGAQSDAREFYSAETTQSLPPRLNVTFAPIRVCYDAECLKPASGVDLFNRTTGDSFVTDRTGYVAYEGAIGAGDSVWARTPAAPVENGLFYTTSGEPQLVTAAAFVQYPNAPSPELRLVLQRPLFVRDLQVSTQWNLEGDPAYKAALTQRLVDASDHLYRFTGGQFALGAITVYQNYAQWDAAATDLWLHSSNAMRPLSYIKGDVASSTPDLAPGVEFVYEPGHIYIGSEWNRFGAPPAQSLPPGVDVSQDWAAALAHELGHYLLGQFDAYIAVLPSGVVTETFACTGSAMGWVYEAANQAFVWESGHWATACANTLGAYNVQRTEWQTIQTWFDWAQTPASATPSTTSPPVPLTSVTFVASTGPAPLVNQVFDLGYQASELASAEARAFLLRDEDSDGVPERILDQGRPPQGANPPQVTLTGAQAGDRLCVIDINDYAELPDAPRHQFGCELIAAGDNALTMRREPGWAPVIAMTPISPTAMGIEVKQGVEGATVRARLYPEHDAAPTAVLELTPGVGGWSGVFTVPGLTPSAFVQVWVEEPADEENPRREAIIDYGVGGGAVPGPKQKIGFAPVTSSDGKAFFLLPANLSLTADQFVALQSMAGTLPLPPATRIFGQTYRLMALPPELVAQGSINIYLANGSPGMVAAAGAMAEERSLYFWGGAQWEKLPTTFSSNADGEVLASAESRGVGVYAVLIEASERLHLPAIAR